MALKFADTAKPMGLFPVAEAVDIELTKKDDTKKSLQAMYDDGELGGETAGGGEENKIDSISVNGIPISPDENKNVDIPIVTPTDIPFIIPTTKIDDQVGRIWLV